MQTDPPKSDPPKRKRRWLQFSLRTLMIGVTVLAVGCSYVGWQAKIVRDRWALRFEIKKMSAVSNGYRRGYVDRANADETERAIPWLRTMLGDQAIRDIELPVEVSKEYRQRVRETFPEADVVGIADVKSSPNVHVLARWPDEPPA